MNICLSIGYPIKTSLSPAMHNAAFKELKINNQFICLPAEVKPEDLQKAVDGIRGLQIRGCSVTMPHKQTIMKYLDKIEETAKQIGAVNLVINDNGRLVGYNTDWIGGITALEKKTNLKEKNVAVLGAGGAARAIIYGLSKKSTRIKIFNRSKDKAKIISAEFDCEYSGLENLEEISQMDIIINATSIGMNEDKTPLDKKYINQTQIVFDIVYSPKETRLIKDAKEKKAEVILGYEMLLYQAIDQFKLYTGIQAPVEIMRKALLKSLNEH